MRAELRSRGSRLGASSALALLLASSGCGKLTVDLTGRPCDGVSACAEGYTCDEATATCIAEGDACGEEGAQSPCELGESGCRLGCRVCTDGAWSACDIIDGGECEPGTVVCAAGLFQACDDNGYLIEEIECGDPGCNATADPPRCNECFPGTTQCVNLHHVECDAAGLVVADEDCETGSVCSGRGVCDDVAGCSVEATAPAGTPCDEGAGANGDFCDSSCLGGTCTVGAPENCDDDELCTIDSCVQATGCEHAPAAINTACAGFDNDLCNSSCDGAGVCRDAVPVDCADTNPCTADDCLPSGVCDHPAGNAGDVCRPDAGDCDIEELCDGTVNCPTDNFEAEFFPCGDDGDDACTDPDSCDNAGNCDPRHADTSTNCGNQGPCDVGDKCDGAGQCPPRGPKPENSPCGDPTNTPPCNLADSCDALGVCQPRHADSSVACGTATPSDPECDAPDSCNGAGACVQNRQPNDTACGNQGECWEGDRCLDGLCDAYPAFDSSVTCGKVGGFGSCAIGDTCSDDPLTPGLCENNGFLAENDPCGSGTSDCSLADTCDAANVCQLHDEPDGNSCPNCPCDDCPSQTCSHGNACDTPCDTRGCLGGVCSACDGGPEARTCVNDTDCTPECDPNLAPGTEECDVAVCLVKEHFACADNGSGTGWGAPNPCRSTTCTNEESGNVIASGVGSDVDPVGYCVRDDNSGTLLTVQYVFETTSAQMPFNIWMRNIGDDDQDNGQEDYHCVISGAVAETVVDGKSTFASGNWNFDFVDPSGSDHYGPGCSALGTTATFCWMAADADSDAGNKYQPIVLLPGVHTLSCVVGSTHADDDVGFDGIIVTNDVYFVPDENDGTACGESETAMTTGACNVGGGVNWGPNLATAGGTGRCMWRQQGHGAPCGSQTDSICNGANFCRLEASGSFVCESNTTDMNVPCGGANTCDGSGGCN